MALLPLLLGELEDVSRPVIPEHHVGTGLAALDRLLSGALHMPSRSGYIRPWRLGSSGDSGISNIKDNKKEFAVNLDVQQFKPEEINVKVSGDFLVIEAQHEERSDEHGFVSRQFTRRYKLPTDVNKDAISSNLSSDGVLSISAPKKSISPKDERVISITQTNKPALKQKSAKETGSEKMET